MLVDVVDPYLFSFVFDKTRTLRQGDCNLSDCTQRAGEGEWVKKPSEADCVQTDPAKYANEMAWSRNFQYLPFDVQFSNSGEGNCRSVMTH